MMFKENKLPKKAGLSCSLWEMGRMLPGAGDHSWTGVRGEPQLDWGEWGPQLGWGEWGPQLDWGACNGLWVLSLLAVPLACSAVPCPSNG